MDIPNKNEIMDGIVRVSSRYVVSEEMLEFANLDAEEYIYKDMALAIGQELQRHMGTSKGPNDFITNTVEFRAWTYIVPDLKALKASIQKAVDAAYAKGVADTEGWTPPSSRNPDDLR